MHEYTGDAVCFGVLRRVFLTRLVDFELLATDGDTTKLVGQFVALLASISLALTLPLLLISSLPREDIWGMEHFLIATTMAMAGLLGIVSWESIFPERRDLLILGPLPVTRSSIFAAKLCALGYALALGIGALNVFTGVGWVMLFEPSGGGLLGLLRSFAAYWITVLVAGIFVLLCVLFAHGVASLLLPRQVFLRASAYMQVAGFMLVLADYVLEPSLESIPALTDPGNQYLLHMLPSYWFLGLFQVLNGSMHPAFYPLVYLAWAGLAFAATGALMAILVAFLRTRAKIVEEADIQPSGIRWAWLLKSTGDPIRNAVLLFSWRTLLRSRQHRLMLGFFAGIGLIVMVLYMHAPAAAAVNGERANGVTVPFLIGTLMMMCLSVLGARIVIAVPILLKANWIFQLTQVETSQAYWIATRRALFTIAVVPAWLISALVCLWVRGGWRGAVHLVALALVGVLLMNLAMIKFRKLPFACSWMPGKTNLLVVFFGGLLVGVPLATQAGIQEMHILERPALWPVLIVGLSLVATLASWTTAGSEAERSDLIFDETEKPALISLKLG